MKFKKKNNKTIKALTVSPNICWYTHLEFERIINYKVS